VQQDHYPAPIFAALRVAERPEIRACGWRCQTFAVTTIRIEFESCERALHRRRPFPAQVRNAILSPKNRAFRHVGNRALQSRGCNCDLRNESDPRAARVQFGRANPMLRVTISRPKRHLASPMISGRIVQRRGRFGSTIRGNQARGRGKPAPRVPTQCSARQIELIENSMTEQRLAMKVRSRLRVICATPFQKRPDSHRSERFLCCVCINVR
jgi:hypothetical protein